VQLFDREDQILSNQNENQKIIDAVKKALRLALPILLFFMVFTFFLERFYPDYSNFPQMLFRQASPTVQAVTFLALTLLTTSALLIAARALSERGSASGIASRSVVETLLDIETDSKDLKANQDIVEQVLDAVEKRQASGLTTFDMNEIKSAAFEEIQVQIEKGALSALEDKYDDKLSQDANYRRILGVFSKLEFKLESERQVVSTRSFFNLFVGTILGGFGVFVLYSTTNHYIDAETIELTDGFYFLSRFLLALLVQFLAYFFLALYRNGLQEVKFYRNELTNVSLMLAGFNIAWWKGNRDMLSSIVNRLIHTERNFILKKGETTAGLLQHSYETEQVRPPLSADQITAAVEAALKAPKPPEKGDTG